MSAESTQARPPSQVRGKNHVRSSKKFETHDNITIIGKSGVPHIKAGKNLFHKASRFSSKTALIDHDHISSIPTVPRKSSKRKSQQIQENIIKDFPAVNESYEMLIDGAGIWADGRSSSDADIEQEEINVSNRNNKSIRLLVSRLPVVQNTI
jgi:hypothetical protein